jgi:hypothetical protein
MKEKGRRAQTDVIIGFGIMGSSDTVFPSKSMEMLRGWGFVKELSIVHLSSPSP